MPEIRPGRNGAESVDTVVSGPKQPNLEAPDDSPAAINPDILARAVSPARAPAR